MNEQFAAEAPLRGPEGGGFRSSYDLNKQYHQLNTYGQTTYCNRASNPRQSRSPKSVSGGPGWFVRAESILHLRCREGNQKSDIPDPVENCRSPEVRRVGNCKRRGNRKLFQLLHLACGTPANPGHSMFASPLNLQSMSLIGDRGQLTDLAHWRFRSDFPCAWPGAGHWRRRFLAGP